MSTRADSRIGTNLAWYRIEELLGRGGMSVVYLAYDPRLDRKVALKLLAAELSEDERFRDHFLRESKLAASLDHPNVIPIYEAGEAHGQLYIAMRYVPGTDLMELLQREEALEPERALDLLSQVAEGLDAAHTRGLVHRDVKPSNVLIALDGNREHAYLADFGLTKPASTAEEARASIQFSGTTDYVSPEQIADGTADARSDVYALGAVLYESLTGEVPYPHQRKLQVLFAHVNDPPPKPSEVRPDLPEAIDEVIATAMAKEPEDRYSSATELAEAAQAAFPEPRRPRWQLVASVGVLALLLVAAIAIPAILLTGGGEPEPLGTTEITTHSVQRIDAETNEVVATIELPLDPARIAAGEGSVWLTNVIGESLVEIDPETEAVDTHSLEGPLGALVRALTAGEGAVWLRVIGAESAGSPEIWRFSPASSAFSLHTGDCLEGLAAGAGSVWCLEGEGNQLATVIQIDPAEGVWQSETPLVLDEVIGLHPVGAGASKDALVAAEEDVVWTVLLGTGEAFPVEVGGLGRPPSLWWIDPAGNKVQSMLELEFVPNDIAATEGAAWLTNEIDDAVFRVDAATGQTIAITVGRSPKGIGASEGTVWVANSRDGTVSRIDTHSLDVETIKVGGEPEDVAVGEGGVWVTVRP